MVSARRHVFGRNRLVQAGGVIDCSFVEVEHHGGRFGALAIWSRLAPLGLKALGLAALTASGILARSHPDRSVGDARFEKWGIRLLEPASRFEIRRLAKKYESAKRVSIAA